MPNIGNYFISNFRVPFNDGSYKKCKKDFCKICIYSLTENFLINFKTGPKISLFSNTSCTSKNIIYFINCIKCNITYIGESKRTALIRLTEHLRKIKNFLENH